MPLLVKKNLINNKIKTIRKILTTIIIILILIIPIGFFYGINLLLFSNSEGLDDATSNFKNIKINDQINNFSSNVGFYSNNPDFFVGEKINVSVNVDIQTKERNESFVLYSAFVSLVTTESEYMPYENGHRHGRAMNKDPFSNDYFYLEYDIYLNFSGKYNFKFNLYYLDTYKDQIYEDEIITKPILQIEPSSVKAQLELANKQSELSIKNTGFAVIVVTLTLVNILILFLNKFGYCVNKIEYYIRINKWKNK